jgi:hypothetical protein
VPEPAHLDAIVRRVSNRTTFTGEAIDPELLNPLIRQDLGGVAARLITDRDMILTLADYTETAIVRISGNSAYRRELSDWVRSNLTRRYDGMPGFTHGVGNLLSMIAKPAMRSSPKLGPPPSHSRELMASSSAALILGLTEETEETFVNCGRAYAHACVTAQECGLATSGLAAAVIDPDTRQHVVEEFGLDYRPVAIVRVGRATEGARHSPRWPSHKLCS